MTAPLIRRTASRTMILMLAVAALTVSLAAPGLASKSVHPYRTDGQALNMRSGPGSNYDIVTTIPITAAFTAECHVSAQLVGGNPIWLRSVYGAARGWTADYYVDTRWNTTNELTAQGIPPCSSSTPAPAPAPLPSSDGDSVWIGSPFRGTWPDASGCSGATFPSYSCSLPSVHWWLANAPRGDWGVDLQGVGAGTAVNLYAAPRDSNVPVTAKVDTVGAACSSGVIADGGYRVTVGLFVRGTRIGSVTYAHVNPSVSAGQTLNRWGQQIGTVGSYRSNNCWRGAHVHFQSYAQSGNSCYNRSLTPSQAMNPSNFMGFVTGRYASGPRSACP